MQHSPNLSHDSEPLFVNGGERSGWGYMHASAGGMRGCTRPTPEIADRLSGCMLKTARKHLETCQKASEQYKKSQNCQTRPLEVQESTQSSRTDSDTMRMCRAQERMHQALGTTRKQAGKHQNAAKALKSARLTQSVQNRATQACWMIMCQFRVHKSIVCVGMNETAGNRIKQPHERCRGRNNGNGGRNGEGGDAVPAQGVNCASVGCNPC